MCTMASYPSHFTNNSHPGPFSGNNLPPHLCGNAHPHIPMGTRVIYMPRPPHIPPGTIHYVNTATGQDTWHFPPVLPPQVTNQVVNMPVPPQVTKQITKQVANIPLPVLPPEVKKQVANIPFPVLPPEVKKQIANIPVVGTILAQSTKSWDCRKCTFNNSMDADTCRMCFTPKNSALRRRETAHRPTPTKINGCVNCTERDGRIYKFCIKCRTPPLPEWICISCTFANDHHLTICKICECPKVTPPASKKPPLQHMSQDFEQNVSFGVKESLDSPLLYNSMTKGCIKRDNYTDLKKETLDSPPLYNSAQTVLSIDKQRLNSLWWRNCIQVSIYWLLFLALSFIILLYM